MKNPDIRVAMLSAGLKHYQVAEALNVADETFSRWLRHDLPDDKKKEILETINRLSNKR